MAAKTCAACDCKLDANPIKVKVGGRTVEVCCDECAEKLKEAHSSSTGSKKPQPWTQSEKLSALQNGCGPRLGPAQRS